MKFIYILVFCFIYQFSYSQSCGSGKFIFNFYTKNNQKLEYEITEVEIIDEKLLFENTYRGVKIDSNNLNGIKQTKFNKNKLPKIISQSLKRNGEIIDNQIVFNTLELFDKLFLLKVSSKKSKIQILVNLFGGCYRKNIIVMSEDPILIPVD